PWWYQQRYHYIASMGLDPRRHYDEKGRAEGRYPNEMAELAAEFDEAWYVAQYPEARMVGGEPLQHFLLVGRHKGYLPNRVQHAGRQFLRFGFSEYGYDLGPPIAFREETKLPADFNLSIAVHLHLFYPEMLEEFCGHLRNIPTGFALFVSVPAGAANIDTTSASIRKLTPNVAKLVIRPCANRGRDVAPFLVDFGKELLAYDLLLHLHTKRSDHNPGLARWKDYLLHYTLGNRNVVASILSDFQADTSLGAVFPPYIPMWERLPSWGYNNRPNVTRLLGRMGLEFTAEKCPDFPAGSFFWARSAALRPLLDGRIRTDDFEAEPTKPDGTTAHAIERLFGIVPKALGFRTAMRFIDVGFNLTNYYSDARDRPKPAARRKDIEAYAAAIKQRARPPRIAVATAIMGSFDTMLIPDTLEADVDYFCFTDSAIDGYGGFQMREPPYRHDDRRRMARYVKTHLPSLLPGYDFIVWIDGNIWLRQPVSKIVAATEASGHALGAIAHPLRASFESEYLTVRNDLLDDVDLMDRQVARYRAVPGLGEERLIETNVMVFDTRDPRIKVFAEAWWNEIDTFSVRDQLSVTYALHAAQLHWHPIVKAGWSARDAPGFAMVIHAHHAAAKNAAKALSEGGLVKPETLPDAQSLEELFATGADMRLRFGASRESAPPAIDFPATSDPRDLSVDHLENGVSLSNWIPARWAAQSWHQDIFLNRLNNAIVFGGLIHTTRPGEHDNGQLFLTERAGLIESARGVWNGERTLPPDLLHAAGQDQWHLQRTAVTSYVQGDCFLLGNIQPHFGHTLLEGLSRLWPLLLDPRFAKTMRFLVYEPELRDFQKELLSLAGVPMDRIVHVPSDGMFVERLWVPDPAFRPHRWSSDLQRKTWEAIASAVPSAKPSRRIYLSRRRIGERPLLNEEQIEAVFAKHGYEIVFPELLGMAEQIRLAKEAAHLAGPVGSQLYLGAFQSPGSHKLVLAPVNYFARDDLLLAEDRRCQCAVIFGTPIDNFADRSGRTWQLDTATLEQALSKPDRR
ncbi:MAG: rhamnan synthesis F family protein, partial [Pseudorhodoplanes sp.]